MAHAVGLRSSSGAVFCSQGRGEKGEPPQFKDGEAEGQSIKAGADGAQPARDAGSFPSLLCPTSVWVSSPPSRRSSLAVASPSLRTPRLPREPRIAEPGWQGVVSLQDPHLLPRGTLMDREGGPRQ